MVESAGLVRRFGRTVVGVARSLLTFNSAMRAIKLVGVTLATRYALRFADAIITTADKVGLAAKELIGLRFAAGLAGIKMADLTKHLEKMAPKLGTIQDVLKGMGVSAAGLALMVEITEKLGVSMNELQSQTVKEAIAAMRRLWTVIKATSLIVARDLGPVIRWAAKGLLEFAVLARVAAVELFTRLEPHIRSAAEWLVQFSTIATNTGTVIPASFGLIAEAGAKMANAFSFIETAWHGLNSVVLSVSSNMLLAFDSVLGGMRLMLLEAAAGVRAVSKILPIPTKQMEQINEAIDNFQRSVARSRRTTALLAERFAIEAEISIDKMNDAWERFTTGKRGEDFKAAFADIAERAAEVVQSILKLQNIGLKIPDVAPAGGLRGMGAAARTAEFQQIALSRVALQGVNTPSRPQIVRDPQLQVTNEQLRQIRTLMSLTRALTS